MIVDAVTIDPARIRKAPGGGIVIDGRVGRSGIQEYKAPDGRTVKVLRPVEEVLAADFDGAPLTVGHPPGGVTPANFAEVSKGHTKARVGVEKVRGQVYPVHALQVNDRATIERVMSGELAELSCCYDATQDPTPGVADGEAYDLVFRALIPNHIALGPAGFARAGRDAKLLVADGATEETVLMSAQILPTRIADNGETKGDTHTLVTDLIGEVAKLRTELATAVQAADSVKDELETTRGKLVAAEAAVAKVPTQIADGVREGIAFRESARAVLGAEYVFDGKDEAAIKSDVRDAKVKELAALDDSIQVADSASDEWLEGALVSARKFAKPHDFNGSKPRVEDSNPAAGDFAAHVRTLSTKAFRGEL